MKKLMIVVAACAMALALSACSVTTTKSVTTTNEDGTTHTTTTTTDVLSNTTTTTTTTQSAFDESNYKRLTECYIGENGESGKAVLGIDPTNDIAGVIFIDTVTDEYMTFFGPISDESETTSVIEDTLTGDEFAFGIEGAGSASWTMDCGDFGKFSMKECTNAELVKEFQYANNNGTPLN